MNFNIFYFVKVGWGLGPGNEESWKKISRRRGPVRLISAHGETPSRVKTTWRTDVFIVNLLLDKATPTPSSFLAFFSLVFSVVRLRPTWNEDVGLGWQPAALESISKPVRSSTRKLKKKRSYRRVSIKVAEIKPISTLDTLRQKKTTRLSIDTWYFRVEPVLIENKTNRLVDVVARRFVDSIVAPSKGHQIKLANEKEIRAETATVLRRLTESTGFPSISSTIKSNQPHQVDATWNKRWPISKNPARSRSRKTQ